jgi:hypothetical protein
MNWYLAKLVFCIEQPGTIRSQFDEQLRLIQAADEKDAYFRAVSLGLNLQSEFTDIRKDLIYWKFIGTSEIIPLKEIKDGIEIYSNTHETNDKENFINSVRQKGMTIQSRHIVF